MPVNEFQRAQTIRLISAISEELGKSEQPAKVVVQAESPSGGDIPIANAELLKEEAEAQGLHFVLHREERGDVTWYVGLISKTPELDADKLAACLKMAREQEGPT